MIIRRFVTALRQQDWGLALLDFLIVVAGIFVGLQVDGWNEGRKERQLESEYLYRLYEDASGSITDFNELNAPWDYTNLVALHRALEALRHGKLSANHRKDMDIGLGYLGLTNPPSGRWGTLQELRATGNIGIITDAKLRALLLSSETLFLRNKALTDEQSRRASDLRTEIMRKVETRKGDYVVHPDDRQLVLNYDFEALSKDREFTNVLSESLVARDIVYTLNAQSTRAIERLRDYLAGELAIDRQDLPTVNDQSRGFPWRINPESDDQTNEP
jgi:hypothetical protein